MKKSGFKTVIDRLRKMNIKNKSGRKKSAMPPQDKSESDSDIPLTKLKKKTGSKITHHGIPKRDPPLVKGHHCTCEMCGKKFTHSSSFIQHYSTTHPPLHCKYCNKQYSNPLSLQKHVYVHTSGGEVCGDCNKSFPFASQLREHRCTHLKMKIRCSHPNCDHEFTHSYDLRKHEKSHVKKKLKCLSPGCEY